MTNDPNEPIQPEVVFDSLQEISEVKKKIASPSITPSKFVKLVGKEYNTIGKCNKILRKITKIIETDEYIFSLEAKDLLKLIDSVTRMKYASFGLITKLYEVCTKNDMLKTYFEDKQESKVEGIKQDARIRDIVNKLKAKAKDMDTKDDLSE